MNTKRTVVLGRVESGGTDPHTLRPLPDRLADIRATVGTFESVGLQAQLVADVALRMYREKVLVRSTFFARHTHIYSYNEIGQKALFRVITTQSRIDNGQHNANMLYLILAEDSSESIAAAFEEALANED